MTYSTILKSQLEGAKRLDAEYYQPEFLDIAKKLRGNKFYKKFSDIFNNGNYGTLPDSEDYILKDNNSNDYIYLIRGIDLRGVRIVKDELIKVPQKYFNKRSEVKTGELLFLVKGATIDAEDSASIVPSLDKPAIFNGSIFKPDFKENILSEFAYVLMRTKYFYLQKRRLVSNIGIEYNSRNEINNYDFIAPDIKLQKNIKILVDKVFLELEGSKSFYSQAEEILLRELGLADYGSAESLCGVVNLSEVKKNKRLDAEFFTSGWQALEKKIKNTATKKLGELAEITKGIEPGAEEYKETGKQFIRVSSLSKEGINQNDQKFLDDELYQERKEDYQPEVGEILLTKDATPGVAYVLKEKLEAIVAGGILRLKLKEKIEAEYLALVLNSLVGQAQAERDAGGSVIKHWKPEQIKNVLIPIISNDKQKIISDLVKKSFDARKKSKELLDEAKRKVEGIIEKDQVNDI